MSLSYRIGQFGRGEYESDLKAYFVLLIGIEIRTVVARDHSSGVSAIGD